LVCVGVFRAALQEDWTPFSQGVFRVLDAHPRSLYLAFFGLECVRALAPGLSDPAAVLHQLLGHGPLQALCRERVHDLQLPLVLATSALQTRKVSVPFSLSDGRVVVVVVVVTLIVGYEPHIRE
jgi:hypothetical protein